MSDNEKTVVPYVVYEAEMARAERREKRQWVIILILIAALLLSNIAWIVYESQYIDEVTETETETIEATTDGGGDAYGTIVSGDNSEVIYGEGKNYQNQNKN